MCNNRHPHADIIIAWANGETIQVRLTDETWCDLPPTIASFNEDYEYRIKPKQVVTETQITRDTNIFGAIHKTDTYKDKGKDRHNLRLYWEGDKLVKAEVIK